MTAFVCVRCGAPVTGHLAEVPLAELPEPVAPYQMAPGADCPAWVPLGRYAVDRDTCDPPPVRRRSKARKPTPVGISHPVLINPADLLVRRLHPNPGRRNGCCGLDGCDGPNLVCSCGSAIAIESSDCWTAQVVRLEPHMIAHRGEPGSDADSPAVTG